MSSRVPAQWRASGRSLTQFSRQLPPINGRAKRRSGGGAITYLALDPPAWSEETWLAAVAVGVGAVVAVGQTGAIVV
jgi:hypothetical protein